MTDILLYPACLKPCESLSRRCFPRSNAGLISPQFINLCRKVRSSWRQYIKMLARFGFQIWYEACVGTRMRVEEGDYGCDVELCIEI